MLTDQPGEPDSILDYRKAWSETIDRLPGFIVTGVFVNRVD